MMSSNTESDRDNANSQKSAAVVESAEILRDNLVLVKNDEPDTRNATKELCRGDDTNISKSTADKESKQNEFNVENKQKEEDFVGSGQEHNTPPSGITIVNTGTQIYTKILPTNVQLHSSNTTSVSKHQEFVSCNQDNRSKRLKEDPHLRHLQLHNSAKKEVSSNKAPLLRSTSMPVCVEVDNDLSDAEKQTEEKPGFIHHRKIFRTGSVSDYTKQRLKTSILMKTSASLVRKPSITDFEMRQIQGDADSSQSDDEDEDEDDREGRFKPVIDVEKEDNVTPLIDTSCRKNVLDTSTTCVVSSLSESNVNLAVAMTSA